MSVSLVKDSDWHNLFSHSICDGCGSPLAGAREALTLFLAGE